MSVKLHRQAEALMAEAELLVNAGRLDDARSCWLDAGRLEAEVFAQIPRDRGKTRGIIAVSAVALLRDAGALDEARQLRHDYLAHGDLPEAWQSELEALVIHVEPDRAILRSDVATPGENGSTAGDAGPDAPLTNPDTADGGTAEAG